MKILVLNSGSSSLKYQLFDMGEERVMAKGLVEKIGLVDANLVHTPNGNGKIKIEADIPDHTEAIRLVLDALTDSEHGVIDNMQQISAVGHRVVHGGSTFADTTIIDDSVMKELYSLVELALCIIPGNIRH